MAMLMLWRRNEMGLSTQLSPCTMGATMMAKRSGWRAASVLGMVSPTTSSSTVTTPVATATATFSSVMISSAMEVEIAATPVLTRLFPSRMGGSRRSGCSTMRRTRAAPAVLVFARCRRRIRWTESSAASEPEKKAESRRSNASSNRLAALTSLHIRETSPQFREISRRWPHPVMVRW